jgi:hypothetical protein
MFLIDRSLRQDAEEMPLLPVDRIVEFKRLGSLREDRANPAFPEEQPRTLSLMNRCKVAKNWPAVSAARPDEIGQSLCNSRLPTLVGILSSAHQPNNLVQG